MHDGSDSIRSRRALALRFLMCSLCGMLGVRAHWTESHAHAAAFANRTERHTRSRERQARTRLANRVLGHYGLQLSDFAGSRFVLRSRTGRSAIIDNLAEIWDAAEQLTGKTPDPLDPDLLESLQPAGGSRPSVKSLQPAGDSRPSLESLQPAGGSRPSVKSLSRPANR